MKAIPQVKHLLLLVGGNPLPLAVAGRSLIASGGSVFLLHSKDTAPSAERLRDFLIRGPGDRAENASLVFSAPDVVQMKQILPWDPRSIHQGVREILNGFSAGSVGLNYTGGTKAMAVHAYQAVHDWARKKGVEAVFSYLDARTLCMRFDPPDPGSGQPCDSFPMGRSVQIRLNDVLKLYGWKPVNQPSTVPVLAKSARALAAALSTDGTGSNALKEWKGWIGHILEKQCRRADRPDKWKSKYELKGLEVPLPGEGSFTGFVRCLREELGFRGDLPLGEAAAQGGFRGPADVCDWFHGKWLESLALQALRDIARELELHDVFMSIEPRTEDGQDVKCEIDVLAMRGYQLFAVSCGTDHEKGRLKLKLFEAAHRARQLGGDEACVALVCCSEDPARLEAEMYSTLGAEREKRIRVFGRGDLSRLGERFAEWIRSQEEGEG